MKRIFYLLLSLILFNTVSANNIIKDSVANINCNHDGFIFTEIVSLDTNVFSKWYLYNDSIWEQIDTSNQLIVINNNQYNSDSLTTEVCGLYKLEIVDVLDSLIEVRQYNVGCKLSVILEQEIIICNNNTGTINAYITGGIPFGQDTALVGGEYFQYQWYSFIDTSINSILLAGTNDFIDSLNQSYYYLIVSDSIGCIDTSEIIEIKPPEKLKIVDLNLTDASCYQSATGSISFSFNGGYKFDLINPYFYYLVSNSDTVCYRDTSGYSANFFNLTINPSMNSLHPDSIIIDSLFEGNYQLIVSDSVGCLFDTAFMIYEPLPYQLYVSSDTLICSSDSVWINIDSISGGLLPITYKWIDSNNDSIYVSNGNYLCVINDTLHNCIDTIDVEMTSLYDIKLDVNIGNISCFGDSTGFITIDSIYGGVKPYLYSGISLNNLSSGDYTISISDSLGCKSVDTISVLEPLKLQSNIFITQLACHNDSNASVILAYSGGVMPYEIYWQNSLSIDTVNNLSSGIYFYSVIDSNQCELLDTLEISNPNQLSVEFINYSTLLDCFNGITAIEAVVVNYDSSYSILWSNLDSTNITSIGAGYSSVFIEDNNGCRLVDSVLITQPDTFRIVEFILIDTICHLGASAHVVLDGGIPPYTYLWSTGEIDSMIFNIQDSICWVIVSDSCGNILIDTVFFDPFELVTAIIYDNITHIGSVEIDFTSTGGPFSYTWVDIIGSVISTDSITSNLCEGTYFVTTNDNTTNCSVIDTLIATFYLPNGIVDETTTTVLSDSDLWGNPPYSYFWDNAEISAHANICSGSHWVEVTDADGCVVRADFDIDPLLIVLDPAEFIIECNLENLDVDITADAIGGTVPYTYAWSNGSTENSINFNLSPGNYSVVVMDNNACTEDTSFVIETISAECIPNVFTPNGDNINDTWNLENTFFYLDSEIRIYGRYGKLLFKSIDYAKPWDGKDENGNDVTEGVYFYHINIGHDFDPIRGSVTIIR
ncbi:MAG: T9SS type B sorting domain-containing protein [Flavobacteriales bacterium]|nr:T9SS type B sorting domain-containing protein [Flavobacteriales bacterium]MBT5089529.1 T9SS type B sorting domain-containing protein [Flavobacteriales bacterium]